MKQPHRIELLAEVLAHVIPRSSLDRVEDPLLASSQSPPGLDFARTREGSLESQHIGTPASFAAAHHSFAVRKLHDGDLACARRGHATDELTSDDILFPDDEQLWTAPLFPTAPPFHHPAQPMAAGSASPINIRPRSDSPRSQQSNSAVRSQQPRIDVSHTEGMDTERGERQYRPRQESVGMLGTTPYGARSIPGKDGYRSDGNALSGSLMNGMSWGGISVGSYIRDEWVAPLMPGDFATILISNSILMAGTSPYNFQSPSFHSSSYLPKMEANYMKDYVCCDIRLDSMHELLQHYEEAHASQPTQTMGKTPREQQYPSSRAANATSTAQAVQQQTQVQPPNLQHQQSRMQQFRAPQTSPLFSGQTGEHLDFENLDGMDMDTDGHGSRMQSPQFQPQPQFGRQQPRGPSVNVDIANAFQGQGLQTPTTPRPGQQGVGASHNPTVSSVNTPTLSTRTTSHQTSTPDSSMPGTPAEPSDVDYSQFGNLTMNNLDYGQLMQQNPNFDINGLSAGNYNLYNGGSGTIDDPAKRLLSRQGYGNNKGAPNTALVNSSVSMISSGIRESSLLNGLSGAGGFVGEEIKPFKCPVIGCEKAYKNQNGLKYHKQHGHQNQQLKENADGTFSIVDPTTSIPYPGTIGMEKEKPYRCEVCGKRYKNLNGLKYHRQHSPPCNPELKLNAANLQGMASNAQGLSANVAGGGGGGLVGITDGMGGGY
ncbi:Transcriptional regulator of ribosomal biogenesis proteins [Teratosphaeriaceae sp. CCFEE 6253]|nr:Transcriptional regulator of ribosomal biogenesis proteins [Teratosphaeriaceae sp. CCFEE 6253]